MKPLQKKALEKRLIAAVVKLAKLDGIENAAGAFALTAYAGDLGIGMRYDINFEMWRGEQGNCFYKGWTTEESFLRAMRNTKNHFQIYQVVKPMLSRATARRAAFEAAQPAE